ncbi:MAG: Tad domain-containing protein, partial [Acidobacteria bacterium]|nr:Tad domain-containing protein [Acidobacteriota bacterium]
MNELTKTRKDRGATAIFIAFSMVMIIGFAAIAVDLGIGFNDRRVNQTSADTGVMSGAVEFVLGSDNDTVVSEVLNLIRVNLRISYDEADWRAMWRGCTDPGQDNFDVGGGVFVDFDGMTEPAVWGATQALPCISTGSSYFRVRIPDQIVDTGFARVIGFNTLTTNAAAVALLEPGEDFGGVIPFGIPGNTAAGEICLKTSGSGTAFPPCQGPNGGGFGEIDAEFFGDFFGSSPFCGLPGATELAQNIALGLDHYITVWSEEDAAYEGILEG